MSRRNNDGDGLGCIVALGMGIICLPFIGLMMLLNSENENTKAGGATLFVLGGILLVVIMLASALA